MIAGGFEESGEDVIVERDGAPVASPVSPDAPVGETVALLRRERARRPQVSAVDVRAAKEQGRA